MREPVDHLPLDAPAGLASDPDQGAPARSVGSLRRQLAIETVAVSTSPAAFGLIFGLTAHQTGLTGVEAVAMSAVVMAGAAQFSALGLLVQGVGWPAIAAVTAIINLRNIVYGAAIAPWLAGVPRWHRAAMAHILGDESFALALAHFRRVRRTDVVGYWITGLTSVCWISGTAIGFVAAGLVPDPGRFGLDAVFPATMACLALALADGRTGRLAVGTAAGGAVALGLVLPLGLAVVVAAILGALVAEFAGRVRP